MYFNMYTAVIVVMTPLLPNISQSSNSTSQTATLRDFAYKWIVLVFIANVPASSLFLLLSLRLTNLEKKFREKNCRHFTDGSFKCVLLNENLWISIDFSLKFVPKGRIYNNSALVRIRAWRRPDNKPLSETVVVRLPTHLCVTQPQWVKANKGWYHSGPSNIRVKLRGDLIDQVIQDISFWHANPNITARFFSDHRNMMFLLSNPGLMRYVKQNKFNTRSYLLCYGVEVLCTGPLLIINANSWIEILMVIKH